MSGFGGDGPRGLTGAAGAAGAPGAAGATGATGPAPAGSAGDLVRLQSSGVAEAVAPATERGVLDATRRTTYAPPGAAPWALAAAGDGGGPGSVSVVGDVLRFGVPSGAGGTCDHEGTFNSPTATLTHGKDGGNLSVLLRVAAVSLGALSAYTFGLEIHLEHASRLYQNVLRITSEGYYVVGYGVGGALTLNPTGGPIAVDGTGWVKLDVRHGWLEIACGVGTTSTPPTTWTPIWTGEWCRGTAYAIAYPTKVVLTLTSDGSLGAAGTVDVGHVLVTDLREV